ncbi:MAG TPA: hypothetical protein VHP57_10230 [Acidimicrobiia bacterium]|jgi:hypothetical protein|nr:hypothetical protein [Acidimicrobiia bacterium]
MKVPGVIVAGCVLLAACSSGGSGTHTGGGTSTSTGGHTSTSTGGGGGVAAKSPAYKTAAEVAAKITAVGMGCADFKADSGDSGMSIDIDGVPKAVSTGTCTIGDQQGSGISVYKDADALKKADGATKLVVCLFANRAHAVPVQFVEGKNWTVASGSADTVRTLAPKLDGKAKVLVIDCSK